MKVSILFITYNHAAFIQKAIQSAMVQDYPEFELVVCDDASPDGTRDLLERELAHCPPHIKVVRAHSEQNVGLNANFNRGLTQCTGDIIVAMSGDDVSEPARLSEVVEVFKASPQCMLVFSDCLLIDADDAVLQGSCIAKKQRVYRHADNPTALIGSGIPTCGASAAYRAILHNSFGPMIKGRSPEDVCFWARALLLGEIHFIAKPLVKWRTHHANLNNRPRSAEEQSTSPDSIKEQKLRMTRMFCSFFRQRERDIEVAIRKQTVQREAGLSILKQVRQGKENLRLLRYSITRAPWKLWTFSAFRLFKLKLPRPCVNTLLYMLKIRMSDNRLATYFAS